MGPRAQGGGSGHAGRSSDEAACQEHRASCEARRAQNARLAAPQVERTEQVLQDSVAPKVSALLSSAAQRLEPAKPPRRRWRKLAGISTLTAAAGAVAAVVRSRKKPDLTTSADADADDGTSAAEMGNGQAGTSTAADADVNGQAGTS